jgi:outer membrane immunogenic protein
LEVVVMKRSLLAGLGLLALAAAIPAQAADLPRGMPYKAPAAYAPMYNWTGFYLGIQGGGGWGDSDWNGLAVSNSPGGGLIGGTAGYNWQGLGSPWVFGLEGDVAWSGVKDSVACGALTCETKNNWFGTVRGRVGYAWDRWLPYVTGGVAFGDIEANRTGFTGNSDTNAGWTIGAGIEGVIAGNWTAKLEYLYADLGDTTCSAAACGTATNVDLSMSVFRAGVNYRF